MSAAADSPRPADPAPVATGAPEDLAAAWLARREAGLSADEQAEFSQWLLADPRHAEAAARLADTWRRLQQPRLTGQAEAVELAVASQVRAHTRRRRALAALAFAGLAAAAALVFAFVQMGPTPATPPVAAMEIRPDRRTLADGSAVEFNAGAEIAVDYSSARRDVRLIRGEAHFAVTKDPSRPFVVTAGNVAIRAVGTAFSVRVAPEAVGVIVTEGRVAVERMSPAPALAVDRPEEPTYLAAGSRLMVVAETEPTARLEPSAVSPAEMDAALDWRTRRVEFTGMRLAEVVALFNRQNAVQLALADAALGEIPISGIFRSDDPEGFSRIVETSAGLRASPARAGAIVLRRANKE